MQGKSARAQHQIAWVPPQTCEPYNRAGHHPTNASMRSRTTKHTPPRRAAEPTHTHTHTARSTANDRRHQHHTWCARIPTAPQSVCAATSLMQQPAHATVRSGAGHSQPPHTERHGTLARQIGGAHTPCECARNSSGSTRPPNGCDPCCAQGTGGCVHTCTCCSWHMLIGHNGLSQKPLVGHSIQRAAKAVCSCVGPASTCAVP